jgi:hypothetical protein
MFNAESWGREIFFVLASFLAPKHEAPKFQERMNFDFFALDTKNYRPRAKQLLNLQFLMPKVGG